MPGSQGPETGLVCWGKSGPIREGFLEEARPEGWRTAAPGGGGQALISRLLLRTAWETPPAGTGLASGSHKTVRTPQVPESLGVPLGYRDWELSRGAMAPVTVREGRFLCTPWQGPPSSKWSPVTLSKSRRFASGL